MADTADIAAAYMPGGTQQHLGDVSDEEEQPQVCWRHRKKQKSKKAFFLTTH